MRPPGLALLCTAGALAWLLAVVVWAAHAPWATVSTSDPALGSGTREVAIRAHAWGFTPRLVRARSGETLRFVAESDDIQHGLAIGELGVNLALRPGRESRSHDVTLDLPDGTYTIHCSTFCGLGHASMKMKLVVGAPSPGPAALAPWTASLLAVLAAAAAVVATTRKGFHL